MAIKVAVIFGGESVEHEISIISASQAIKALNKNKYEVIPLYISKERDFYYGPELMDVKNFRNLETLKQNATKVTLVKHEDGVHIEPVQHKVLYREFGRIDVAIPVVHGTNGEDGTLQGYLEMLKIPYAGCDVIAAGIGQDKAIMKQVLSYAGLPMSRWFWFYAHDFEDNKEELLNKVHEIGYPVILKPACLGSSIGIEFADNDEEFIKAVEETSQFDFKIVVEEVVQNLREINCSVLGSCFGCQPSVLEEVTNGDFLSFEEKYQKGAKSKKTGGSEGMASTARKVPADLPEDITNTIKDYAVKAFRTLGSAGVCRIDFMMNDETKQIYLNEINTIPGSLAFYLWKEEGVNFTQLMDALVNQAIDRTRRKAKMTFSYQTNVLETFQAGGAKGAKKL